MLANIVPDPLNPLAVSVPHKQRGIPRVLYSRTYWNVAPERGPEPTRTLPPISELIASMSLSEPPRTESSSSGDQNTSQLPRPIGGPTDPSTPLPTLPSILELSLPDPFAHRHPPQTHRTAASSQESKPCKAPARTNISIPSGVATSSDGHASQRTQQNVTKRVTNPQPQSTKRTKPPQVKLESRTQDLSVPAKPRRIQGQRTDLILAKRVKPVVEDTVASTSAGPKMIEETRDSEVEGKGWSTDGQEHITERPTLPIREKKQSRKRRTMSDPYPLLKGTDNNIITPRKEGMYEREASRSTTGSQASGSVPHPQNFQDLTIIEFGSVSEKEAGNSAVAPHREDKRGKRRDLSGWRD